MYNYLPVFLVCTVVLAGKDSFTDSSRADMISAVPGNSGRLDIGGDTKEENADLVE